MWDHPNWLALFKFGKSAHLEDFRNGVLHMNPQRLFSDLEKDAVRADPLEGIDRIHQPQEISRIVIKNNTTRKKIILKPENLKGPLCINFGKQIYNLFCMYSVLRANIYPFLIDERNMAFGDAFIVVLNTQEFINRVGKAVRLAGLCGDYNLVEYYDAEKFSGDIGPFRKPKIFDYQREFRIAVYPGSTEPIRLSVGNLEDITTPILPLIELNKVVDFSPSAARAANLL